MTIKTLRELRELADGRTVYVRYSRSHKRDIARGYSLDHGSMARESGLSVVAITPEDWGEYTGWVAGLIADYAWMSAADERIYGWIALGEENGTDSDNSATIVNVEFLARMDPELVAACRAYSHDRDERNRTHRGVNDSRPWPQAEDYGLDQ